MDKDYIFSNEINQSKTPLMEITPEDGYYQSQNGIYNQSQPTEIIPISSSDFPSNQNNNTNQNNNEFQVKEKDYENFRINSQMNKYHVKQPTPNTFHISTGDKWLPLIILLGIIFFILFVILGVTGKIQIEGEAALLIIFSPCIVIFFLCYCLKQFCCTYYNADIIMLDDSLIIKRRSCIWRSKKTYFRDQINNMKIKRYNDGKNQRYKLDIILSDNETKTLLVLPGILTSNEVDYFNKVVNNYIKYKMRY